MNISDIGNWIQCERRALREIPERRGPVPAAAWVGKAAHAMIGGGDPPETPDTLVYDAVTPSWRTGLLQAEAIAIEVGRWLGNEGLIIAAKGVEVPARVEDRGVIDLMLNGPGREIMAEIKTGRMVGAAWLQLGGYLAQFELPPRFATVLHVPRVADPHKIAMQTPDIRSSTGLIAAWLAARERITDITDGSREIARPGLHCKSCKIECPVRMDPI